MHKLKYSIIVPMYNTAQYIENCIKGVKSQTYEFWELILVNDGSTDNTEEICRSYCEEDERIILLNKENGGVSSARNAGICRSTGDYITFIDSDDSWEDCFLLEALYNDIKRNEKVSVCLAKSYTICYPSGKRQTKNRCEDNEEKISGMQLIEFIANNNWSVCLMFVKGDIVRKNKIMFDPKIKIGEDADWMFSVCLESSIAMYIENKYYVYNVNRVDSAMTKKKAKEFITMFFVVGKWIERYKINSMKEEYIIACALANNASSYVYYIAEMPYDMRKRLRSYIIKHEFEKYLHGYKKIIWKSFNCQIFFEIYIHFSWLKRKMNIYVKKIAKKMIGYR